MDVQCITNDNSLAKTILTIEDDYDEEGLECYLIGKDDTTDDADHDGAHHQTDTHECDEHQADGVHDVGHRGFSRRG